MGVEEKPTAPKSNFAVTGLYLFDSRVTEIAARLGAFLRGEAGTGIASGRIEGGHLPGLVFVFSGQGTQWLGMGRELLEQEPVFRASIDGSLNNRCEIKRVKFQPQVSGDDTRDIEQIID